MLLSWLQLGKSQFPCPDHWRPITHHVPRWGALSSQLLDLFPPLLPHPSEMRPLEHFHFLPLLLSFPIFPNETHETLYLPTPTHQSLRFGWNNLVFVRTPLEEVHLVSRVLLCYTNPSLDPLRCKTSYACVLNTVFSFVFFFFQFSFQV